MNNSQSMNFQKKIFKCKSYGWTAKTKQHVSMYRTLTVQNTDRSDILYKLVSYCYMAIIWYLCTNNLKQYEKFMTCRLGSKVYNAAFK